MENKLHVAIAIIKKLFKNKDKEHLEKSRCSFYVREIMLVIDYDAEFVKYVLIVVIILTIRL